MFFTPLSLSTADKDNHQSQKENHTQPMYHPSFTQPPTYIEHVTMTPGRSYHLSDITFTSALNGGPVQSGKNRSRSASGTGAYMNETAQQKYLRLKERQRKLKILRRGLMTEGYEGHDLLTLNPDLPWSDTRSVLSGMSFTQGEIEYTIRALWVDDWNGIKINVHLVRGWLVRGRFECSQELTNVISLKMTDC